MIKFGEGLKYFLGYRYCLTASYWLKCFSKILMFIKEGRCRIMPNYNYECQDCHHVFEITASIKDMEKNNFPCKECGSKNTKRLFDGFGYSHGSQGDESNPTSCPTCQDGTCSLG